MLCLFSSSILAISKFGAVLMLRHSNCSSLLKDVVEAADMSVYFTTVTEAANAIDSSRCAE